jgi:hypothetical protein
VCFDLNWDGTGTAALQSNTFSEMYFGPGAYGLRIGAGGFMGSENLILNCYIGGQTIAGVYIANSNALCNTMIGGNIAQCAKGIWVQAGSMPTIHGVSFQNYQNQTDIDIEIGNFARDTYSINACRSESVNFLRPLAGTQIVVSGCSHLNSGAFIDKNNATLILDCCYSLNGNINGDHGPIYLRGCTFQNSSYLSTYYGPVGQNI